MPLHPKPRLVRIGNRAAKVGAAGHFMMLCVMSYVVVASPDSAARGSAMTSPVPAGAAAGASRSAPASPSLFSSPMHKGKVAAIGSPGSGSVTLTAANPLYDAAGEKPSRQPRSSLAPKPRDADGGLPKVVSDAGGG